MKWHTDEILIVDEQNSVVAVEHGPASFATALQIAREHNAHEAMVELLSNLRGGLPPEEKTKIDAVLDMATERKNET